MCCLTGVCNVKYPHPVDPVLWADIVSVSADGVVMSLRGEVDVCNQHQLDAALTAMMATKARKAIIDASECTFISVQGYAAIGRCSSEFDSLTLRTCLGVARRVLRLLGFEGVVCVPARAPAYLASTGGVEGPEMQTGALFHLLATQSVG
jgi:anti-anti-sigma regulatory factor